MKVKYLLFPMVFVTLLLSEVIAQQDQKEREDYYPNARSLSRHEAAPEWFVDAKLGIYFHWGPYSVPAFGSAWYPHFMYIKGSWINKYHQENFGAIEEFGYEDFIPMFTAECFDPEDWANLFRMAGAKFAGPVAQHHDGFAMWDSEVNPWNAMDMGPKRDVTGELFEALKERNIRTLATFHHARNGQRNAGNPENWGSNGYDSHYPYHPDLPTATTEPKLRKLFGNWESIDLFNQYWLNQVDEVVRKYDPDILWYDSWLNLIPVSTREQMAANFFNNGLKNGQEVVLCHKQDDMPLAYSVHDIEQGGRRDVSPIPWMTDITLGERRWMYVEGEKYKDAALVVRNMIDVWSKNGIVLLNVSPRADGVINQEQRKILKEIGGWMAIHKEAVYGTRPHTVFGWGPAKIADGTHGGQSSNVEYTAEDIRFTVAKDKNAMYVFLLGQPKPGATIELREIGGYHRNIPPGKIRDITVLGTGQTVDWELSPETLTLVVPDKGLNEISTVFKMELERSNK
ncbi:alpha-L-fucosidase [Echinicola rosea]|uniref:alpha-L-fucosidase n=1 Tax=Echinicola rosea TaxID=1807691 RepID=A0ABQ1VAT8_9BACT|nr:alpha-L-fucosidase [Echinicola rosea]GGF49256.1 alpha-L-fucosidase [Echinicola rosea]